MRAQILRFFLCPHKLFSSLEWSTRGPRLKSDKVPKSQLGTPWGPRPQNSDPEVPRGSNKPRTHVPKVWSRSNGWIAHDRTIGRLDDFP